MIAILIRRLRRLLAVYTCLAPIGLCNAAEVWVVTDSAHSVRAPSGVRVTELDAATRIERELSIQLPVDASHAANLVQQRMAGGGRALQRELAEAYQGIVDAWSAGVMKVPAVIVDRRYIVYGEGDVERAVRAIEHYRSSQP
jgi:integrating conjugative element protein (TIGR03757 family)